MRDNPGSMALFGLAPMLGADTRFDNPAASALMSESKPDRRNWAIAAGVFADLSSAYANFSQIRQAQTQAKAEASALSFRARMLELDRRAAEQQAQSILGQGQSQIARLSLESGQRRAEIEASTSSRGVEASGASAIEAQASERLIEAIDAYNINLDTVQQANAARRQATNIGNQARLARAGSVSLRRQARAAAPETAHVAGLGRSVARTSYLLAYKPE